MGRGMHVLEQLAWYSGSFSVDFLARNVLLVPHGAEPLGVVHDEVDEQLLATRSLSSMKSLETCQYILSLLAMSMCLEL